MSCAYSCQDAVNNKTTSPKLITPNEAVSLLCNILACFLMRKKGRPEARAWMTGVETHYISKIVLNGEKLS